MCHSASVMVVIEALAEAARRFDLPQMIRVNQGCQFASKELDLWACSNQVTLGFSRPGLPVDNADAETFHARVRMECLGQH
jgi:putative transposase